MRRGLLILPLVFVGGLFVAFHATAAVKDANATAEIKIVSSQYQLAVANIGDVPITSFTFVPGPALKVSSVASASTGSCAMSAPGFTCSVMLAPPPCACNPGDNVIVLFNGTGDSAGSKIQIGGVVVSATGGGGVTPPTTTTTPTTTPTPKPKVKPKAKTPKCKKGQKSTKKKPCHK